MQTSRWNILFLSGIAAVMLSGAAPVLAADLISLQTTETGRPVFLTLLPDPQDFKLFASGGSDGNWYVGYNTCWVAKLPPAPPGSYTKAFLGARLGRAKSEPVAGSPPWIKQPIDGEIDIALSNEAIWPESRRFKLTETTKIPTEGDSENSSEAPGEARWFWTEIPVSMVNFDTGNFVALFSPSPELTNAGTSPILAAGRAPKGVQAWLNSSVRGQPPLTAEDALKTQMPNFAPAICLKLVPANDHAVAVRAFWAHEVEPTPGFVTVESSALGTDVEQAWLETSQDNGMTWQKSGRPLWNPPYFFRYKLSDSKENTALRVNAADIMGNQGASQPLWIKDGQKRLAGN